MIYPTLTNFHGYYNMEKAPRSRCENSSYKCWKKPIRTGLTAMIESSERDSRWMNSMNPFLSFAALRCQRAY